MSRQSLPKLLGELRAQGVTSAEFHQSGRLASVTFAPAELPDPAIGQQEPNESATTGAARRHLAVLRQGHEQKAPPQ